MHAIAPIRHASGGIVAGPARHEPGLAARRNLIPGRLHRRWRKRGGEHKQYGIEESCMGRFI